MKELLKLIIPPLITLSLGWLFSGAYHKAHYQQKIEDLDEKVKTTNIELDGRLQELQLEMSEVGRLKLEIGYLKEIISGKEHSLVVLKDALKECKENKIVERSRCDNLIQEKDINIKNQRIHAVLSKYNKTELDKILLPYKDDKYKLTEYNITTGDFFALFNKEKVEVRLIFKK